MQLFRETRSRMYWMFAGYMTSFYVALAVHAAATIGSHPRPVEGLLAHFMWVPLVIAAFSSEVVLLAPRNQKRKIRDAFERGALKRRYAYCAGAVAGVAVLVCFGLFYLLNEVAHSGRSAFLKQHEGTIFWSGGLVLLFIVALAPSIPASRLVTRAERNVSSGEHGPAVKA